VQNKGPVNCTQKKIGFFESERDIADAMFAAVGLREGQRHPLAFLMEACDDICYSMIDAEDVIKKCIVSVQDLISYLKTQGGSDPEVNRIVANAESYFDEYRSLGLSSSEINDVTTQRIRVDVVGSCLDATFEEFVKHEGAILTGTHGTSLIDGSSAATLVKVLKDFDRLHAYSARPVRQLELKGYNAIREVMSQLWKGIERRECQLLNGSVPTRDPYSKYTYSRVSEGYRRAYESRVKKPGSLAPRYYSLQLLCDMVSGMTDNYLLEVRDDFRSYKDGA